MSLPQHMIKGQGGTLVVWLLDRPSSNAVVSVIGPDESTYVNAQAATIESISTTLNGAHVADQATFNVANAANITEGCEIWLREPTERVTVKLVSGNTVTPWEPLLHGHADGVTVESTKVTYDANATEASTLFFDGRIKVVIDGSITEYEAVECTEYPLPRRVTLTDVRRLHAKIVDELDAEDDPEALLNQAHEDMLEDIGGHGRARCFTGSGQFKRAAAMRFLVNHYGGNERTLTLYEHWLERYNAALAQVVVSTPRDGDQDGHIEENEVLNTNSVPVRRS